MIPQITQPNLSHVIFAINLTNHILTKQQQQQNLPENIKTKPRIDVIRTPLHRERIKSNVIGRRPPFPRVKQQSRRGRE